ncbi:methionyl-tRNA formyltransferase [Candidatus Saccharibacteria bacterium]|nr:methionyl-tRNA formyltransferase [Candidatus Saccharibacteria bacterium]
MTTSGAKIPNVPIIFFGVDRFPALPLEKLLEGGYNVKAIFAAPDKDGRGGKKKPPIAKVLGEKYNIPVYQPLKGREILPILQSLEDEEWYQGQKPLGVLVSYGKIIPQSALDWFKPYPIINIHPSLLPKYRGSSPVESAILNGDKETGVSIIELVAEMDAGDILAVEKISLEPGETSSSLYEKAANVGWEMVAKLLRSLNNRGFEVALLQQDHSKATFTPRFEKAEAELDNSQTAETLERKVRAFDVSPRAFMMYDGKRFQVHAGEITDKRETELDIATADGKYYSPTEITPEGKRRMTVTDYLRGQ